MKMCADNVFNNRQFMGTYGFCWYALIIYGIFAFSYEHQRLAWWLQLAFFIIAFAMVFVLIFASLQPAKSPKSSKI